MDVATGLAMEMVYSGWLENGQGGSRGIMEKRERKSNLAIML